MTDQRRILVVEDEPVIAMDLADELAARGWSVIGPVGSLAKADKALGDASPEVALMDINLGGSNTYDLVQRLHDAGVPVIFLSGESGDTRPAALKDCPLLSKPLNYDRLIALLDKQVPPR